MTRHSLQLRHTAPLFAALGDPNRLAMVSRLCAGGPLPTIRLKQATRVSRQAVTRHLQMLEETGIVKSQRVGRDRLWWIETRRIKEIRRYLDQISAQWDATSERLRRFVEDDTPDVTALASRREREASQGKQCSPR
jgi:DNA-binding transcriptional ArsR family regulator